MIFKNVKGVYMLTISFEKYDNLDTEAELFEISDDYTFPKIQDFQSKLDEKNGLFNLLVAYYNTTDSSYRQNLQQFLYREVKLVDTLDDKPSPKAAKGQLKISKEKNLEILRNVKDMDFQLTGFFPTKRDIDDYVRENTEINLAFLYWVINTPMDDLTSDEQDTIEYIKNIIGRRVKMEA